MSHDSSSRVWLLMVVGGAGRTLVLQCQWEKMCDLSSSRGMGSANAGADAVEAVRISSEGDIVAAAGLQSGVAPLDLAWISGENSVQAGCCLCFW